MIGSLLLAAVIVATQSDVTSVGAEIQSIFFTGGPNNTNIANTKSSKFEEMVTNSTDYNPNMGRLSSKLNSGRNVRGTVRTGKRIGQAHNEVDNVARRKRLVLKHSASMPTKWIDGVFYAFNTTDQKVQELFKKGAKAWTDVTCVDFVEDKNATDKVIVVKDGGCWADNGRHGGDQFLSLNDCATTMQSKSVSKENNLEGVAVHEIGHVLGLLHTMARKDRDNYITVVLQNVEPSCIDEFDKADESYANDYGTTYDYGSIMHYPDLCFSKNRQLTMIAKDPFHQKTMGSQLISFLDSFIINEHYGCNARCNKSTSAKCANEGFPHPRNCSICICPGGYGGALCDQRPPGCGEDLVATRSRRLMRNSLGQGTGLRDQFDFCKYMITAPTGKRIEVNVQSISYGYDYSGCPRGGVEVKAQRDQKSTGYRFCSMNGSRKPIVSSTNRVPVILFSRLDTMHTVFTYRYID